MNWAAFLLYVSESLKFSLDIIILKPKDLISYLSTNFWISSLLLIVSSVNVTDNEALAPIFLHLSKASRIRLNTCFPERSTLFLLAPSLNPSIEIPIDTPKFFNWIIRSSVKSVPLVTIDNSVFLRQGSILLNLLILFEIYTNIS